MIFQGDVIIAELLRQGIDDLRKNPWLIDDVFSSFLTEPALKDKYGQKEIDRAKEWFMNNKIDVNLRFRMDKDEYPCVSIALGGSSEIDDMKSTGDLSADVETLIPSQIGKPIPYIVKPFTPDSYDEASNSIVVPSSVSLRLVRQGMVLVDTANGSGYVIEDVKDDTIVFVPGDEPLSGNKFAVIPKYQFYRVRREHSFFQESYQIGCHVAGDPAALLWLHSIVVYLMLRYRESMLEGRQFAQSSISSTDLLSDGSLGSPGVENIYSRYINLTGQVEHSWLKAPMRVIEAIEITKETDKGLRSGIKILSNLDSPDYLDTEDDPWTTIDEDPEG